jgi:ribulose-phosphate 3-epimerase
MHRFHACLKGSDLPHLAEQACWLVQAGVDVLHLDVIETPHLPTLTRAPALVQALRHQTRRIAGAGQEARSGIELHLTGLPDPTLARACVQAGADAIIFPADSSHFAVPIWRLLRREGCRAGLALHPTSSLDTLCGALGSIDQVLVVLSPPDHRPRRGWLERALPRLESVRKLMDSAGGGLRLQAEGPLQSVDVAQLARAGVDDFVVQHRFADPSDAVTAFAQMRAGRVDGAAAAG